MAAGQDELAEAVEDLFADWGGESGTYTQPNATAISVTDAALVDGPRRSGDPDRLDLLTAVWVIRQSDLAAISPSPRDTWTHGSDVWTVDTVEDLGLGAAWQLSCSRRRAGGVA